MKNTVKINIIFFVSYHNIKLIKIKNEIFFSLAIV
jgi:hypothetical protein